MSHRLFNTVGADVKRDANDYVRIYDQAMGDMKRESVKIVHIYAGAYGRAAAHRAVRGEPKWDKLFAVLDLIPPTRDAAAYDQRQWIMTVEEFKELASLGPDAKENHHGRRTTARTDGEGSRHR